jgi:rhamnulose-1-phosphate aldolase/alcohol dehydrogenase
MKTYKHVNMLWDNENAQKIAHSEIDLLLYRSNLLGRDLRITNFGGGNTSCKTLSINPLTKNLEEVMYVKGSGGDIGTLSFSGLSSLYMEKLNFMRSIYRGIEFEDEMVDLYINCMYDHKSAAPSIDTALHAFLPFRHVDHLHPDSIIAIAASKNSKEITKKIWGGDMGWLPWQRPGFDLGIKLSEYFASNPHIKGIMLEGHGFFTWGNTSFECYMNSLDAIEKAGEYIDYHSEKGKAFGGVKIKGFEKEVRLKKSADILPYLRSFCSEFKLMVGHYNDDPKVLEFVNSNDLDKLASMGTSCPDHFLRTKIKPLTLNLNDKDFDNAEILQSKLKTLFDEYRSDYKSYYEVHKHSNSPDMRDPNPVVILYPGVGMFTFAKNKQTARISSEFYLNAINVMRGSEAISEYVAISQQEAFDIEYWLLEEAKLKRQLAPKSLFGRIAIVTGAGGGIGTATADALIANGAVVMLTDINEANLKNAVKNYSRDTFSCHVCDITKENEIEKLIEKTILEFGGVDTIINSAGIAISNSLENTSVEEWDLLQNILVKAQFMISKHATKVMKKQSLGGDIINIVSKNALVSGPNNVAYGTAKAAQLHMSRLLASELAPYKIKVNVVNPDAVIIGSKIWEGGWAEGRAKAYGISVDELPAFYAKRTLMNEIIMPEDIASAVISFLVNLKKSTGNLINVDGGIAQAFPR